MVFDVIDLDLSRSSGHYHRLTLECKGRSDDRPVVTQEFDFQQVVEFESQGPSDGPPREEVWFFGSDGAVAKLRLGRGENSNTVRLDVEASPKQSTRIAMSPDAARAMVKAIREEFDVGASGEFDFVKYQPREELSA